MCRNNSYGPATGSARLIDCFSSPFQQHSWRWSPQPKRSSTQHPQARAGRHNTARVAPSRSSSKRTFLLQRLLAVGMAASPVFRHASNISTTRDRKSPTAPTCADGIQLTGSRHSKAETTTTFALCCASCHSLSRVGCKRKAGNSGTEEPMEFSGVTRISVND